MPPAIADLRACLTDCQVNRGLDPMYCQEECASLTPGDVGPCTSTLDCFFTGGFTAPSLPEVTAPVERLLVLAIVAGVVFLAIRFT